MQKVIDKKTMLNVFRLTMKSKRWSKNKFIDQK